MKPKYYGKRIKNLTQLYALVQAKGSIADPNLFMNGLAGARYYWIPAAFVFNLSGQLLNRWMQQGMYVYKRKP